MPIVSISEAARLVKRNRKTLHRYISIGQLSMSQSDSGAKGIEISELIRVFGELSQSRSDGITVTKSQEVTDEVSGATGRIDALVAEIDGLRALLVSKDDVIDSQKKHIDSLENTVMLLTHDVRQSNSVVVRRWWKFWS